MKKLLIFGVCAACATGAIPFAAAYAAQEKQKPQMIAAAPTEESAFAPSIALKNIKGCTFEAGVESPAQTVERYRGVKVTTAASGTSEFTYNGICDLKDGSEFLSFLFLPEEMGVSEADALSVTLTDVYDDSKYITMDFHDGENVNYPMGCWVAFGESGKYSPFGYEWNGTVLDNGTGVSCSWRGLVSGQGLWQSTRLFYDVDDKAIYTTAYSGSTEGGLYEYNNGEGTRKLLFDFDSTKYLGANVFEGFSTNEVYISVKVSSSVNAHLLVTKIAGIDLGAEKLSAPKPKISVDFDGYDEKELPYGIAGEGRSYPVFGATAYSAADGIFEPQEIAVTYGNENIPVKDGRFSTAKAGVYTVSYKAVSKFGAATVRSVRVQARKSYERAPGYEISEEIPSAAYIGEERIYLPDGVSYGGSGRLGVECSLKKDGESAEILKSGAANYFVPEIQSGDNARYLLTYTVTDITGKSVTAEKEIIVTYPEKPVLKKVFVPAAIRKEYAVQFAKASAVLADAGGVREVPVKVRADGQFLDEDLRYTPQKAGNIRVEYVAYHPDHPNDENFAAIAGYTVGVLSKKESVSASSYFLTSGMSFDSASEMSLLYRKTAETGEISYANLLNAQDFTAVFDLEKGKSSRFYIELCDGKKPEEKVTLKIESKQGMPVLYSGKTYLGGLNGSFDTETPQQMQFSYDNFSFGVYGADGEVIGKIENYDNGVPFAGFTSGGVYVTFRFDEATENGAGAYIYSLNRHSFSSAEGDRKAPEISLKHDLPTLRYANFGENVLVSGASAWDVFGEVQSLNVRIVAPDRSKVYEGEIGEDYFFNAGQYGIYTIVYTAADDSGRTANLRTSVSVTDSEAPKISGEYLFNAEYRVGDTVQLPGITATDNKDETPVTYYVVILPTGEWKIVKDSYTFTAAGNYVIRVVAADEAMNSAYFEYAVTVR